MHLVVHERWHLLTLQCCPQKFHKYGAMTMEERDAVAAEWRKTVQVEEAPPSPSPKR